MVYLNPAFIMQKNYRKHGISKPRKVRNPNGESTKQMIMGMGLGLHLFSETYSKVLFNIKAQVQRQVLLIMLAPFFSFPLAVMVVPMLCLAVPMMVMGGIMFNLNEMGKIKDAMDDSKFQSLEKRYRDHPLRQSRQWLKREYSQTSKQSCSDIPSLCRSTVSSTNSFESSQISPMQSYRNGVGPKVNSQRIDTASRQPLSLRPRAARSVSILGRPQSVTRSRTFTFSSKKSARFSNTPAKSVV